jgi:hypothetical protein
MPVEINRIAIPPQSEVLNRMEAGERIATFRKLRRHVHEIGLPEDNGGNRDGERPNVKHFDLPEGCDMRNKTVHTRTDINVPLGTTLKNPSCDQQVLIKVVAAGTSARLITVAQARHCEADAPRISSLAILALKGKEFTE